MGTLAVLAASALTALAVVVAGSRQATTNG